MQPLIVPHCSLRIHVGKEGGKGLGQASFGQNWKAALTLPVLRENCAGKTLELHRVRRGYYIPGTEQRV